MALPTGLQAPPTSSAWAKGPPTSFRTAAPLSTPSSFFPPIKLAVRQPGIKEGFPAISFTTAEVQEGRHRLQHSLVAKFSGGRPKIEEVRRAFKETWALEGAASIGAWDARHILIILKSEDDAKRVLAHPMRKVGQYLFRLFRWTPDFHSRKESTVVTAWVRLPSLPPELFDQGYIKPIISMVGNFIAIDEKTRSLSNPCYARACVEIDVARTIPEKVWVGLGGQGFWQFLEFESNLFYCSQCKIHGHQISGCRRVKSTGDECKDLAPQSSLNPARVAVVSDSNIPVQISTSPPMGFVGTKEAQLDKDVSIDLEGWQIPKKKKNARKGNVLNKEYRVKSTQMALSVVKSGPGLEAPTSMSSDSAKKQLEEVVCPNTHPPTATLELGPPIETIVSMSMTEVPSLPNSAPSQPQEVPILPPALDSIDPDYSDLAEAEPSHEVDDKSSINTSSVISNPPIHGDEVPSLAVDMPRAPEDGDSDAVIKPDGLATKEASPSLSASTDGGSNLDLCDVGPSTMSSAERKSLFKAERKAEKAARKAERKAKYKRGSNFVFND